MNPGPARMNALVSMLGPPQGGLRSLKVLGWVCLVSLTGVDSQVQYGRVVRFLNSLY